MITGVGEDPIAAHVAHEMAWRGAHVIIGSRDKSIGDPIKLSIIQSTHNRNVDFYPLDQRSMYSVTQFVQRFQETGLPLHTLITFNGKYSYDSCSFSSRLLKVTTVWFRIESK